VLEKQEFGRERKIDTFTLPFDAPPLPPSPTPEQLAFLESSKLRHSTSNLSFHGWNPSFPIDPSTSAEMEFALFERRNPDFRKPQLSLPNIFSVLPSQSGLSSSKSSRPSVSSTQGMPFSRPGTSSRERPSSVPSASSPIKDAGELSTVATSIRSNRAIRRGSSSVESSLKTNELDDDEFYKDDESSDSEIDFRIHSERKIANARLCDVLRILFGSNGCAPNNHHAKSRRVGITPECKEYLFNCEEPRILEISLRLRSKYHLRNLLTLSTLFSILRR
jgi:hypothetical protein